MADAIAANWTIGSEIGVAGPTAGSGLLAAEVVGPGSVGIAGLRLGALELDGIGSRIRVIMSSSRVTSEANVS
jgi:hypothetical protein